MYDETQRNFGNYLTVNFHIVKLPLVLTHITYVSVEQIPPNLKNNYIPFQFHLVTKTRNQKYVHFGFIKGHFFQVLSLYFMATIMEPNFIKS